METNRVPDFIIIDDDVVNNLLCRKVILMDYPGADIQTFTEPALGLAYLQSDYARQRAANTVLFLDINMPEVSGWDFLQSFEKFDSTIKEQLKIYVLSSSINPMDKVRAGSNKNVWDYIEKPLTRQAVEDTVARIREEERSALSREIHDELGQKLVRLKMDIVWLSGRIPRPDTEVKEKIASAIDLVDETIKTIRRINTDLRPRIIDDLGLFAALEWQSTAFTRQTGISCKLMVEMEEPEFSKLLSIEIYRIYQEALANITRHAGASHVLTRLSYREGCLILFIKDDGAGMDMEKLARVKSFGILGMKERATLINATIGVASAPGEGMEIELSVPLIINSLADET